MEAGGAGCCLHRRGTYHMGYLTVGLIARLHARSACVRALEVHTQQRVSMGVCLLWPCEPACGCQQACAASGVTEYPLG